MRGIVERSEAARRGLPRYFTGRPCKNGHVSERFTSNGMCRACVRNYNRAYNDAGVFRERRNLRYAIDPEPMRQAQRRYNRKHRHKLAYWCSQRRAAQVNATPAWADKGKIREIYARARDMTDLLGISYEVDHIVPLQGRNVCGLHVENNLRVIPATDNKRKRNDLLEAINAS